MLQITNIRSVRALVEKTAGPWCPALAEYLPPFFTTRGGTMLPFFALFFLALIAKLEELFFPQLLESQRRWFRNYRFQDENSVFCLLCRQIPVNCPAERIGLPPMCKLNPLFNEMILMQLKASDFLQQDFYIQLAA